MTSELTEIKDDVKVIKSEVKDGFSKVNGRITALEIAEAKRQGRESVLGGSGAEDWKKIAIGLVGIMSAAIGLAVLVLKYVLGAG